MAMLREKLRKIYDNTHADALFIECDFLRRYLTGFYSTDGYVLLDGKSCKFFADPRYFEAAQKELMGSDIEVVPGSAKQAHETAAEYKTLGIPFPFVNVSAFNTLKASHEIVDCMPALKEAMLYKSEQELALIQKACDVAEEAFLKLLPELKEGMTESEAAALLEYYMRTLGASGVSFETICAFGAHGSVPHYETGNTPLKFGDAVLIDFGCKVEGYCSDITRTFLFGDDRKHESFKQAYGHILKAHNLVKEQLAEGMTGSEADGIARGYFKTQGLDKYFTHALGHGIGLQVHEYPVLSPRVEEKLGNGMVFSNEPGIYIAGELGIRIEDSMYMKGGKAHSFMNKTNKNLIIL